MVGALLQVCAPVILDGRVADVQEVSVHCYQLCLCVK